MISRLRGAVEKVLDKGPNPEFFLGGSGFDKEGLEIRCSIFFWFRVQGLGFKGEFWFRVLGCSYCFGF